MNGNKKPVPPKPDPEEEKKRREQAQRQMRFGVGYLITAMIVLWLFQEFILTPLLVQPALDLPYSEFRQKLAAGQVLSASIGENDIMGEFKTGGPNAEKRRYGTIIIQGGDPRLVEDLQKAGVEYSFRRPPSPAGALLLSWILPLGLLGVFWYFAYRRMGAGGGMAGIFGVGKSKATAVKAE